MKRGRSFQLLARLCLAAAFAVPAFARAAHPAPAASSNWEVEAGAKKVFVEQFRGASFASIPVGRNPVAVTVRGREPVRSYNISPHSDRIEAKVRGNTLTFSLDRPLHLVVTINNGEKLLLFAEPVPTSAPKPGERGVVSVRDLGIDSTGSRLETARLQQAIDRAAADRAVLYFPAGVYLTGTLALKSNSSVYLAEGARLLGSDNPDDYPVDPGADENNIRWDIDHWLKAPGLDIAYRRLLLVDGVKNVRVAGPGIIEGRGGALLRGAKFRDVAAGSNRPPDRPESEKPVNIQFIMVRSASDVTFEGITLLDSPMYNAHVLASDRVTFRDVKIVSDLAVPNTDGIDPDSSRDVLIERCFFLCADDCVSVKTSAHNRLLGEAARITVRDCVFVTRTSGTKFGNETFGGPYRDITFEDIDILDGDRAITLSCMDGHYFENLRFIDVRIEKLSGNRMFPFHVHVRRRHPQGGAGYIHNVVFQNVSMEHDYPASSKLAGLSAQDDVRGIRFVNYTVAGRPRRNAAEAKVEIGPFVSDVTFEVQPTADSK